MSDMTNAYEEELYEAVRADTPHLALFTAAPTESAAGTEVAGNGYARMPITLPAYNSGIGGGATAVQFDFPAASGTWGVIVAVGIFDALSAGNLRLYKAITPTAQIVAGMSVRVSAGGLTVAFD